jgi:hypothetical protein
LSEFGKVIVSLHFIFDIQDMNDILIVPDIHGRKFWEPALEYKGEVVFLGDYVDPYPYEGFVEEDAHRGLLAIIDFKKQNSDRVTLLVGNHELHYYNDEFQASRFSRKYYGKYHALLTGETTAGLFQVCKQIDNYLFIHAGITKLWYDAHEDELKKLGDSLEQQINKLFETNIDAFFEISSFRGGYHDAGSPLWADIHEHSSEKEHFDGNIIQIIGHTQLLGEWKSKGNIRLLDNRKLYILKDGEIELYP